MTTGSAQKVLSWFYGPGPIYLSVENLNKMNRWLAAGWLEVRARSLGWTWEHFTRRHGQLNAAVRLANRRGQIFNFDEWLKGAT